MTSSPPRVARRLMSAEDGGGSPMLSIPLERLETPPQRYAELGRRPPPSGLLRSRRLAHDRVPLRSNMGTHYLFAHVGNPPQRVSLIVDTGSYTLAFPCAGCKNCRVGQRQSFWDPQVSKTGFEVGCDECQLPYTCFTKTSQCTFRQSYNEGSSWSAYQMHDIVRFGGKEIPLEEDKEIQGGPSAGTNHVNFGCIHQQSGMFDSQAADGIIGLGPHKDSIVWQMAEMGALNNKQFSLCLSQNGGNMVLGGFDPMLLEPGEYHEYTPANFKKGWFSVKVEDVSLGDTRIASPEALMTFETGAGTIVDSGTTDTYLPQMMASDWQRAWLAAVKVPFQNCAGDSFCMTFTPEDIKKLPVFTITLSGGVTLSLPAEGYMEAGPRVGVGRVSYAPRIYLTEKAGAVLGANLMMDRNVLFDVSNERLGFVKARCDFDDSVKRDRARERKETRNVTVAVPPKPNDFQIFVPVDAPSNVPQNVLGNDPEGAMNKVDTVGGSSKVDEKEKAAAQGVDASGGADVVGDKGSLGDAGTQEGASGDLGGLRKGESGDEREGAEKEQVVDCEFELLGESPCDVECPRGLELPRTVKGSQKFFVHVTVPAKGAGKPCPGDEAPGDGGMPLKIETCDVVCEPDGGGERMSIDKHGGEKKLEGGNPDEETGGEVDKEGAGRVGGSVETSRKNMGNPDGHLLERECSASMAWLWSRCSKGCTQEMFEEDDCNGVREVRYCDTGDLCPTGREGIYADLIFKIHIPELAVAQSDEEHEERWRLHVGKALVESLAVRVADSCRVGPGNIEATLLPSECEHCDGNMSALLSVHMADPSVAMIPESLRFELDDPCITALGGEALASELTPGVVRTLIGMAGRLSGAVELADVTDVIEVGRLSLRSATTAVPIIDNAASGVVGERSRTSRSDKHNHLAGVGRQVIPSPSSPSSAVIFVVQVAVIIAIIGVLLLMKWWRGVSQGSSGLGGERMVASDMRKRREGKEGSVSGDEKGDDEEAVKHSRGHQRRNSSARLNNGEKDRTR